MSALLPVLTIAGAVLAAAGAVDAYRDRMRETTRGSGLYTPPSGGRRGLTLALIGAGLALVGGILGFFA